jgi:hypothetical protein
MDKDLQAKVSGKADVYLHNHLANSAVATLVSLGYL